LRVPFAEFSAREMNGQGLFPHFFFPPLSLPCPFFRLWLAIRNFFVATHSSPRLRGDFNRFSCPPPQLAPPYPGGGFPPPSTRRLPKTLRDWSKLPSLSLPHHQGGFFAQKSVRGIPVYLLRWSFPRFSLPHLDGRRLSRLLQFFASSFADTTFLLCGRRCVFFTLEYLLLSSFPFPPHAKVVFPFCSDSAP